MKSKTGMGNSLLAAGALFLAAALLLTGSNLFETYQAGQASERLSQEVFSRIGSQTQEADSLSQAALAGGEEETPEYLRNPEMEMPVEEIEGNGYIGLLEIPALGLSLPVMSEWNYARLKLSPCRYTGSTKTGDLVICAHNYTRHFGPIKNLSIGDAVYFTDMDGMIWEYEVAAVDILQPTDIEDMTAGDYDLTLFTCTYGGQSRVTVRCEGMDNGDSILKQGE